MAEINVMDFGVKSKSKKKALDLYGNVPEGFMQNIPYYSNVGKSSKPAKNLYSNAPENFMQNIPYYSTDKKTPKESLFSTVTKTNRTTSYPYGTDPSIIFTGKPEEKKKETPPSNGMSGLDNLYALKLKAISDALGTSREAALASLAEQRAAVSPLFEAQRGGLQAASAAQARNFAEYMANRGLASSGESAQARLMQGTALQSGLTQLGSQEAATLANIEKEKSRIETDYQNKLAQARTQNQIEKLTQRYNEQQAQLAAASQSSQVQQFDKLSNFGKNTYARTENMLNSGMTPDEIITFLDNQRKNGYITSDEMDYIASQFGI
jgi:hypothetical protein